MLKRHSNEKTGPANTKLVKRSSLQEVEHVSTYGPPGLRFTLKNTIVVEFLNKLKTMFRFMFLMMMMAARATICNSDGTEWNTIQGVIARIISKSDEHEA